MMMRRVRLDQDHSGVEWDVSQIDLGASGEDRYGRV